MWHPRYARPPLTGGHHAARGTGVCRHLRHRGARSRQGLSGQRDRCATTQGHRLDAFQPDADRVRADPRHAVRHRRRSDDRARSGGGGARGLRRRFRARAFLSRRYPQHRRHAVGVLPARVPAPRHRGGERGVGPAPGRRVRAGVRLYRQPASRRRRVQSERVSPPGDVRREFRRGDACRRRHAGFVSCRIWHAAVRGDGGAGSCTDRGRPCGDHARDGAGGGASAWVSGVVLADARGVRASATACTST